MTLYYKTAHELHQLIEKRDISVEELIKLQFARINEIEEQVRAFTTLNYERAIQKAHELDMAIQHGESVSALLGIPIAYKDNICTKEIRTTCSSKILEDYLPPYNATVVDQLEKVGLVSIGKTNLDEFAMGSSTENSAFFATHNPWDIERVPGGSSGGSAAAVAAGEAVVGLGSDTGGSIRQPAAFCGVVGLKPTYGLVSRYGLVAFASSLDQIGPVTRDVTDSLLVLRELIGYDHRDSTSVLSAKVVDELSTPLKADVKGLKIGIPVEYFGESVDSEICEDIYQVIHLLTRLGVEAEEIAMPHTEFALPAYHIIATAEASSNLARFDGVRYGYRTQEMAGLTEMYRQTRSEGLGSEVKRRIMLGTYALSSGYYDDYYLKAQKVRTLVKGDFIQALDKYDLLITPTTPTTAFKLGENTAHPLAMYMSDLCTVPVNLAGVPAITLPVGFDHKGLPIGLQLIGNYYEEATLLRVAYTLEQALGVKEQHPILK